MAEEPAGFRPGRSTVEQIFNSRVIIQKHLQHQCDLFNNFIDFKIAFWQSLARTPVAGPWKLQHRRRTSSSHSDTICELQQCSPLEESAMGVLQDNSRCSCRILTLTHPVKLVPREDHAGNTPCPPHIYLHWWKANMQPMICRRHWSYGRQQRWTSRLHQQTRRQSNGIWNGRQHRKQQGHDQQHEQHQCSNTDISMNDQKLEEVTSSSTLEQPCAKMAPAQQKSASELPQQWQQSLD